MTDADIAAIRAQCYGGQEGQRALNAYGSSRIGQQTLALCDEIERLRRVIARLTDGPSFNVPTVDGAEIPSCDVDELIEILIDYRAPNYRERSREKLVSMGLDWLAEAHFGSMGCDPRQCRLYESISSSSNPVGHLHFLNDRKLAEHRCPSLGSAGNLPMGTPIKNLPPVPAERDVTALIETP